MRLADHTGALDEAVPFIIGEVARADVLGINPRFHGKKPIDQLVARHFQTENRHGFVLLKSDIFRHIEDESRLSHGRTGSHQNQIGRLETRRLVIQIQKARRDTGHVAFRMGRFFDAVHGIHDNLPNRHE